MKKFIKETRKIEKEKSYSEGIRWEEETEESRWWHTKRNRETREGE